MTLEASINPVDRSSPRDLRLGLPDTDPPYPRLSVVVPCFNEEAVLGELYRRVSRTCRDIGSYEIILINDGSRDDTWNLMCQLAEADPRIVAVSLSRDHGHQLAL